MSLVLNTLESAYNKVVFKLHAAGAASEARHQGRVQQVQRAIQAWRDAGAKTKLCSARPGWMTMSLRIGKYKKTSTGIPVSHLCNVLRVDTERGVVFVEPNVSMAQITVSESNWMVITRS